MLGRHGEAIACYRQCIDLGGDVDHAREFVVHALVDAGRGREARHEVRAWCRSCPESAAAKYLRATLGAGPAPARAAREYMRAVFDRFAPSFDLKLAALGYVGPALVESMVRRVAGEPAGRLSVLDAGCGTGLCGPILRPWAERLEGVDLSSEMLVRARRRGHYDVLVEDDLVDHLNAAPERFDLVSCAETLCYFGPLEKFLRAARRALVPGGALVFTVERSRFKAPYRLARNGRYAHRTDYLRSALARTGFEKVEIAGGVLRYEHELPVQGSIVAARRPARKRIAAKASARSPRRRDKT